MTEKLNCKFYIETEIFSYEGKEKVDTGKKQKLCMLLGTDCNGKCEHMEETTEFDK